MNLLKGFIVVCSPNNPSLPVLPSYRGVFRTPTYPSAIEGEKEGSESYVFGDFKDDDTNMIPTFEKALVLYKMLTKSGLPYEILFCCQKPADAEKLNRAYIGLGFDVAGISGDYWSIVGGYYFEDQWSKPYLERLNEHGLFESVHDAEEFLGKFRAERPIDRCTPFDIVYVCRLASV